MQQQQQQQQQQIPQPPPEVVAATLVTEPQLIQIPGGVVLIMNPGEFYRKKEAFTTAGPASLQVYSDFERVFTKNKISEVSVTRGESNSGSCVQPLMSDEESRTPGTAEVLEGSESLSPQAQEKLHAVTDSFLSAIGDHAPAMDEEAFESYSTQCQEIIVNDGKLHISALPSITRAATPKMGLREGWAQALKSLTVKNVPTFLFSSGYGDIVMQLLLQGGVEQPISQQQHTQYQQGSASMMPASLPMNMRIISNFCRTGPDGTVRAFSSPIVRITLIAFLTSVRYCLYCHYTPDYLTSLSSLPIFTFPGFI